jgi:hypothetical protein
MARDSRLLFHAKNLLMRAIRPDCGQEELDQQGERTARALRLKARKRERVRCSSLVDQPVYPRLRRIMQRGKPLDRMLAAA